ncbi:hypothetical protein GmHk_02G003182 [Glycine max]|nr:hypothetical protein GmHk_02G003182 [Glycine max]
MGSSSATALYGLGQYDWFNHEPDPALDWVGNGPDPEGTCTDYGFNFDKFTIILQRTYTMESITEATK